MNGKKRDKTNKKSTLTKSRTNDEVMHEWKEEKGWWLRTRLSPPATSAAFLNDTKAFLDADGTVESARG
jgi:hypothetical protein